MCEFQSLYFNDDGYVVRCKQCGLFQVGFSSTMLTLTAEDFAVLRNVLKGKCAEEDHYFSEHSKSVIIPTPAQGVHILLTRKEAEHFSTILEEADTEAKALQMIQLFNS